MHILLVNDDGYGAAGIEALAQAASERGHELLIVAPKTQQSGKGHCFTLTQPLFLTECTPKYPSCKAYMLDGSPADCVRIGLRCLAEKPVDIVISGINKGFNAGIAIHYSGTIGAAMEGVFHHLPSIAASIHHKSSPEEILTFARYVIEKAEKYVHAPEKPCTLLNINAPLHAWKGEVYCPLGTAYFDDSYIRAEAPYAGTHFWLDKGGAQEPFAPGTDDDWLEKGYLTLTLVGNYYSEPAETLKNILE